MRPPEFWSRDDLASRAISAALLPLGVIYGESVAWKHRLQKPYRSSAAVVCVGNLTVGGAGKTPIAIALARMLDTKSAPVFFLTRGYHGRSAGALHVDTKMHDASFVGDEALLLARAAPTIVATDRAAGARLARSQGARVIVMDDGHQNFSVAKDLSVVVVDSKSAFGNGRIVPAGPLRETVRQGLARADVVILMGQGNPSLCGFSGKVCRAALVADRRLDGRRVVAFAGIGRPNKFFDTLNDSGAEVVECHSYGDHHVYSHAEIGRLKERAARARAALITTEKDFVRLNAQDREDTEVLYVRAEFEDLKCARTFARTGVGQGSIPDMRQQRSRMRRFMTMARYGAEAAPFFAMIALFRLFPLDTASALGGWLGRTILYRTSLSRRARANLAAAYPEMAEKVRERTIREMWDNLGRTIAEFPHLGKLSIKGDRRRIALEGLDHVEQALASGKGIIFISAHFANWEVLPLAAAQYGLEGGGVYRPVNNPFVDRWMVRQRQANGPVELIAKGAHGTRRIFTLLRAGKAIFMLVDQKTNEGVAAPFFGRDAMTTPVPAALALKLGAILLPVSNERLTDSHFRMTVHPAIAYETSGDHALDVLALTIRINEEIEAIVRRNPSQWLWIHRRWPKPGDMPRSRRGKEAQALAGTGVRAERDGSSLI